MPLTCECLGTCWQPVWQVCTHPGFRCLPFCLHNLHLVCFCVIIAFCPFQCDFLKISRKQGKKHADTSNRKHRCWKLTTGCTDAIQGICPAAGAFKPSGHLLEASPLCSIGKEEHKWKEQVKLGSLPTKAVSNGRQGISVN